MLLQIFSCFTFDCHFLGNYCPYIFYTFTLTGMQQLEFLQGTVSLPKLGPGHLNKVHGYNYASPFLQKGYKEVSKIAFALVKPFTISKFS